MARDYSVSPRPWTPEEVDRVRALRDEGIRSTAVIAKALGRSRPSVQSKLRDLRAVQAPVVAPGKPGRRFTPDQRAFALAHFRTDPQARALAHLITGIPA
jgi:hypothetical protein